VWERLGDLFAEEPDGYLRFRRSLLRDAAYEGLPFKLRRQLHAAVAACLEEEMDFPEEMADVLALHYYEAGEYRAAWRYALIAAKAAEGVYANVEAARLYSRALEAGRKLTDISSEELATAFRALGDAWNDAGEFGKACEAYIAARGHSTNHPLMDAELLLKLATAETRLGKIDQALQTTEQSRAISQRVGGPEAARLAARAGAWYAKMLQIEGRIADALDWAERTVAEAQEADESSTLADAYVVMGWAYGELGKDGAFGLLQRALEAYQRSGNLSRQADVLLNLGSVSHWEGRWDDALSFWERGRGDALRVGDTVGAALARINVAEILTDRGEWAEAEKALMETMPLWKATQHRYYLAGCLFFLGRVCLRTGRLDEALARLQESRSNFEQIGAKEEVPLIEARIAECHIAMGNADAALELVRGKLDRVSESSGVGRVVPLLQRVQAHALLMQGDLWGARDALEASLAAARERQNLFDAALTMLSLIEVDRLEGVEPPLEVVEESRSLLAKLKVRAVPPVPLPAT
jgi:tetratricopeptide (TPR) repeat protein